MPRISPDTAIDKLEFVAFDTETTGLSPVAARLVELSGVRFRPDGESVSSFSQLIHPEQDIPPESTAIHGITSDMVAGMPPAAEVVPAFFRWVGGDNVVLVAHNAPFDLDFLAVSLGQLGIESPALPVIDTLPLARRLLAEAPNHQLRTLVEYLGLEDGEYHRALADSHHVRGLVLRLFSLLPDIAKWQDLAEVCPVIWLDEYASERLEQAVQIPAGFEELGEAIASRKRIEMRYNNGSTSMRIVTPQSVHSWRGNLYMNAYCHTIGAERTFRLDKIVKYQIVPS